jgi:hypothetical protein
MKTKITYRFAGKIMMITLAALITVTCDRVKDDPYYAGTWEYKDNVYVGEFTYNTTRTLGLTATTYEEIYVMQRDNSATIATILGLKGNLEVNGSEMTFRLNAVGECVKDGQNQCTSTVEWFAKGTTTYNTYIQYLRETVMGEFEASEDYLWLVRDSNNDGDTEDTGEDIYFDRL